MEISTLLVIVFILAFLSLVLNFILFMKLGHLKDDNAFIWQSIGTRAFESTVDMNQNTVRDLEKRFDALSNHLGIGFYEEKAKVVVKDYKEL